ncbi:DUF7557 family protein [Natronococcus occultus]|uniref:Uncharacterized protein n=1 Tax=Natronococcus occultus SP4 TaxID=694430 RepID=L0K3N1_9EURY|nr:hypothetical protein [Natronococcus occultus]AGB39882.1 hypothetical protein Natoc_4177 [Natronococcus occultus SP4]
MTFRDEPSATPGGRPITELVEFAEFIEELVAIYEQEGRFLQEGARVDERPQTAAHATVGHDAASPGSLAASRQYR